MILTIAIISGLTLVSVKQLEDEKSSPNKLLTNQILSQDELESSAEAKETK